MKSKKRISFLLLILCMATLVLCGCTQMGIAQQPTTNTGNGDIQRPTTGRENETTQPSTTGGEASTPPPEDNAKKEYTYSISEIKDLVETSRAFYPAGGEFKEIIAHLCADEYLEILNTCTTLEQVHTAFGEPHGTTSNLLGSDVYLTSDKVMIVVTEWSDRLEVHAYWLKDLVRNS